MIAAQMGKKLGLILRILAQQFARSRTGVAVVRAVRATANHLGAVLHQLWLEVTGFTFLAIAAFGAMAGVREYGKYQSGHAAGPGRLILAICFTVSFAWFGLSSFWRVRRKRKA